MSEFISGLSCGLILLSLVLMNFDKQASNIELSLKIGNILCEDHKGLLSFDVEAYTCVDNTVIKPDQRASKEQLQNLEQKLDK